MDLASDGFTYRLKTTLQVELYYIGFRNGPKSDTALVGRKLFAVGKELSANSSPTKVFPNLKHPQIQPSARVVEVF